MLLLSFTKIAVSILFLRLKANCLLKNCAVYSRIYIEFQLLHFLGTNTSVKFVVKIARLFRGQIDPLIMFGRDILNFIAGLAQWRSLAQTLTNSLGLRPVRFNWERQNRHFLAFLTTSELYMIPFFHEQWERESLFCEGNMWQ